MQLQAPFVLHVLLVAAFSTTAIGMTVAVRPATLKDRDAVATLFREVLPTADYTKTNPEFARVETAFVEWKLREDMNLFFLQVVDSNKKNRQLYVAHDEEETIIGMAGVILQQHDNDKDKNTKTAELVRMNVRSSHQRQGVGQQLLHGCEEWAMSRGVTEMVLDTWVINKSAQQFYEGMGYTKTKIIAFELVEVFHELGLDQIQGLEMKDLKSWEMTKKLS